MRVPMSVALELVALLRVVNVAMRPAAARLDASAGL